MGEAQLLTHAIVDTVRFAAGGDAGHSASALDGPPRQSVTEGEMRQMVAALRPGAARTRDLHCTGGQAAGFSRGVSHPAHPGPAAFPGALRAGTTGGRKCPRREESRHQPQLVGRFSPDNTPSGAIFHPTAVFPYPLLQTAPGAFWPGDSPRYCRPPG
jgi:hypothetical protein